MKRGEGPTKEWDRLWITGGSPGGKAEDDVDGGDDEGFAFGVGGPKTSAKSKSLSWAEDDGIEIASLLLRLLAKRDCMPFFFSELDIIFYLQRENLPEVCLPSQPRIFDRFKVTVRATDHNAERGSECDGELAGKGRNQL